MGPWEFERAAQEGELAFEDVLDAVLLESMHMEVNLKEYFEAEQKAKLKARQKEIKKMLNVLHGLPEGEKKEQVRAKIKRLNQPVKG